MTNQEASNQSASLTKGRILFHSTLWGLAGQVAPLIAAIFAIPFLINGLGTDRFGVLTLVWILIGYFNIFDFGLARAITKIVSEKIGFSMEDEIPAIVWTGIIIMVITGVVGGIIMSLLATPIVTDVLNVPEELKAETVLAIYVLSAGIPFVVARAGLAGVLQAQQRFDLINIIQIPIGIFMFVGPLIVLPFSQSLFYVTLVLVLGRVATTFWNLSQCLRTLPILRRRFTLTKKAMKELLKFGSWMTVSNIVSPLMVRLDRFLIGALISVTAVAYYSTPYEMVTKLWLVPTAIVGTLFPAFAVSYVENTQRASLLFNRGVKYIFLALFPFVVIIITLSDKGMNLWLGAEFSEHSTMVLQLLAVGVLLNSLAQVPFVLIQGMGRPDMTAKLHMMELVLYLPIVWWAITRYGIEGAAIAWVVRIAVDTTILFFLVRGFLPKRFLGGRRIATTILLPGAVLIFAMFNIAFYLKVIFLACFLICFIAVSWLFLFADDERNFLFRLLRIRDVPPSI